MSLKPRRVDFSTTWKLIRETLDGVITCGVVQRVVWNERFSDVYKLCTAVPEPHGDSLYKSTKEFLEEHVKKLLKEINNGGEENMLELYHRHWDLYNTGASYLNQLYGYLNNTYIKKQKFSDADVTYGVFSVDADCLLEMGELAKDTWKNLMIDPLKDKLVQLVLQEITKDRHGYSVNQTVIHSVVTSLVDVSEYKKKTPLELYQTVFETPFLKQTGDFYRQETARLKAECSCSEYLEKVIQRIDNENFRSRKFLHSTSYKKVTMEVQSRMVADIIEFLHGECKEMVVKEQKRDMSYMYQLLKSIYRGLDVLVKEVENHIKTQGSNAVLSLKNDPAFVDAMLGVHFKYKQLIQEVFSNDQAFTGALDKACSAVINSTTVASKSSNSKPTAKAPELLAKYVDSLLKKSTKGVGDSELDEKLSGSIIIFKYLEDKDVFQRFYSRNLAKRLIYSQSASMDAEESMITKLKQACGYEFTNKLHRMFTDVGVSTDLVSNFNQSIRQKDENLGISFSILVFQAGAWPITQQNNTTFHIPSQLESSVRLFEEFYNNKFNGRKLTWMQSLSTVELKMSYLKKPYIVSMSTFQMACMLPFETADKQHFLDVKESTNLPEKELVKQMQTLVDSKLITSQDSPVNEKSTFHLNMNYSNKRTKFKIMAAVQKETQQEVESTHSAVDEDRKLYLQAAIVRIMKARKTTRHNDLIHERETEADNFDNENSVSSEKQVITQAKARFAPNISMIKKSIESLIEKEYLKRVTGTTDQYSYIA